MTEKIFHSTRPFTATMLSRLADRMEDDVVRQSLIILGCALVAGVVLGTGRRARGDPGDLSARQTVERAGEDAGPKDGSLPHHASSTFYAPADSYLMRLLSEEQRTD